MTAPDVSLEKFLDEKCLLRSEVLEKAICKETALREAQMAAASEALRLARETIEARLEALNHLHDLQSKERQMTASKELVEQLRNDIVAIRERIVGQESKYITTDWFQREHAMLVERVTELRLSMGKLVGLLVGAGVFGGTTGAAIGHFLGV